MPTPPRRIRNMNARRLEERRRKQWNAEPYQRDDGMSYSKPIDEHHGIRKKLNVLPPLFKQLEERGFIGKVILDVGSAKRSVSDEYFQRQSRLFYPTTGKKIIRVDVGFEKLASEKEGILDLQADIEDNSLIPPYKRNDYFMQHVILELTQGKKSPK